MIIVARAVFHENNKYYSQVFLAECLYKFNYLIKYKGKQKHLLSFYVTNNKSKKFCINNIYYKNEQ